VRIDGELMEIWLNEVCDRKPQAPFSVSWFDDSFLFVFEVQEVMSFFEAVGEGCLPLSEGAVALFLLAE